MLFQKNQKTSKKLMRAMLIVLISVSITPIIQIVHSQSNSNNQWALNFWSLNEQNVACSTFAPFDQIQLVANVTYGNASVPDSLVTFKAQDPTNTIKATNIEPTNNAGEATFLFRLPIEDPNNGSIVGTWQATATIQTSNGPLQESLTFSVQWSMEIASITLENSQGQNQTSFSPGNTVTVKLAINNNAQAEATNITLNMQDTSGKNINNAQIQNTQIGTSNPTQEQDNLQIPKNATTGQATITATLLSGNFEGVNIPASESKTASFTVTQAKPTPKPQPFENTISLFSWLLVATAFFTFTSLTIFMRRKPYSPTTPSVELPITQTVSAPVLIDQTQPVVSSNPTAELLTQQIGLQPLATQLSSLTEIAKRIEALQSALKIERERLSQEIVKLEETVNEQEKEVKKYFDSIREEMRRIAELKGED
jgi:hypothetical protein